VRLRGTRRWHAPEWCHTSITLNEAKLQDTYSFGLVVLWAITNDKKLLKLLDTKGNVMAYVQEQLPSMTSDLNCFFQCTLAIDSTKRCSNLSELLQFLVHPM